MAGIQWKKIMGLQDYQVRIYKDKKAWGYTLTVKYHALAGGDKRWKGWTKKQAVTVAKKLQAKGVPAKVLYVGSESCFTVTEDEKTVALNKLTAHERNLLGV